ncbi:hypothetical protein ACLKA6_002331 [Drosophila palustris]
MVKILQLNLNHCRAAQDLLAQTIRENRIDVAVISEPYAAKEEGVWLQSLDGGAGIWSCASTPQQLTQRCYIAPRLSLTEFSSVLEDLAQDTQDKSPILIAGDWGSSRTTPRGSILLDTFARLNVCLLNTGSRRHHKGVRRIHGKGRKGSNPYLPVAWWNDAIAKARRECHAARRQCQRHRNSPDYESLAQSFRLKRKKFKDAIKLSKARHFQELCEAADSQPFGSAYKMVMVGPDDIPDAAIKAAIAAKPEVFVELYNKCIVEGTVPRRWKLQRLVLIPKAGKDLDDPSSYRPFAILQTSLGVRKRQGIKCGGSFKQNDGKHKRSKRTQQEAYSRSRDFYHSVCVGDLGPSYGSDLIQQGL